MIYGKLTDIEQYKDMEEIYKQLVALSKVKAEDVTADFQRVEVNGDTNFFTMGEMQTKHLDPPKLEVHHKAADIHCVFEGLDVVYFGDYEGTEPDGDYIEERDVAFLTGKKDSVCYIRPGEFAILMPEEVHSPLNSAYGCEKVKKAVGKIFFP